MCSQKHTVILDRHMCSQTIYTTQVVEIVDTCAAKMHLSFGSTCVQPKHTQTYTTWVQTNGNLTFGVYALVSFRVGMGVGGDKHKHKHT